MFARKFLGLAALAGFGFVSQAGATVYNGNAGTGFGGPVGTGTLNVTDSGGSVTFTFTPGAAHPSLDGNNLVIYLATGAAGLADTSSLISTGNPPGSDAGNTAVSGYNNFNQSPPSRSTIVFPSGFKASYAFSFANAYDSLYQLPTDGSGQLSYITGATPVNNNNTLTIPLSTLGLTQGQALSFVATDIDGGAAYRSNEAFGNATIAGQNLATYTDAGGGHNPAFNNEIDFTSSFTYQTTPTPEPASTMVLGVAGLLMSRRSRRA